VTQDADSPGPASPRPLWAPWRIQYICAPKADGCFLCAKARDGGEDEANHVIGRGTTSFVLLNDFPYNSGHIMVAPYRHVADLLDLTPAERLEIMELLSRSQRLLARLLKPDGLNVGFNMGAAAGAGLRDHVHGHLVPRWIGDTNFMPVLADTRVVPQSLLETTRLLRQGWAADAGQGG